MDTHAAWLEHAVQEYLFQHGYHETLLSMEKECGSAAFDPAAPPQPAADHVLYPDYSLTQATLRLSHMLSSQQDEHSSRSSSSRSSSSKEAALVPTAPLLTAGPSDTSTATGSLPHPANVIATAWNTPSAPSSILYSACVDGCLRVWGPPTASASAPLASIPAPQPGPLISLAPHPALPSRVAAGSMAGGITVVDYSADANADGDGGGGGDGSATIAGSWSKHAAGVTCMAWDPAARGDLEADVLASGSYDHTVLLSKGEDVVAQFEFEANVEAVQFLPSTAGSSTLVIAPREDACLHLVDVESLAVTRYNMNALGDNWVSHSVLHIAVESEVPGSSLVMATTDASKSLLFDVRCSGARGPVRTFYGPKNDGFAIPSGAFAPRGMFLVSGQDSAVHTFHVPSGTVFDTVIARHDRTIRGLAVSSAAGADWGAPGAAAVLATASFDRTVGVTALFASS